MRTCPACGRQYGDDVTVCPVDEEPLGAVTVASASQSNEPDPETVVRPRRAQPIAQPRFTEIKLERPAPDVPEPAVRRTGVPDRVYREEPRSVWPAVLAITLVAAGAVAVLLYFMLSEQSGLSTEVGAQITEARVAVADARARVESLPPEQPLRQRLLSLQQWDRELQQYELSGDRTREMSSRAREIMGQARSIAEEARVAGATLPATPPVVPPAEEPPATPAEPASPSTTVEGDPQGGESDSGTKPEPQKPAEPPPPAPSTTPPPADPGPKPDVPVGAPKPKAEQPSRPPDIKPPPPADSQP